MKKAHTMSLLECFGWTTFSTHFTLGSYHRWSVVLFFSRPLVVGTMPDERTTQHLRSARVNMNDVMPSEKGSQSFSYEMGKRYNRGIRYMMTIAIGRSVSQGGLRTEINQINAKIRKSYAQLKRSRWRELCKNLDSRTTNSKLGRIVKKINKEQEQCEESNSVIDTNGQVFPDDKAAANGLAVYYKETSKLVFTSEDKFVMKRAKNISSMAVAPLMWVIRACPGTSHSKNFC
ncbi:uncharacterized protein TNCV_4292701 [Trichonephila clavipes]|uniref:Uncharacterized protein n=1 Tax=Trichonephila clavipes TaxID=2585209 RepID=A0A8X6RHH1_TRICX|nr:uncharacterized protein TNCV_4292701 [Trichonephila clavipes]